MGMLENWKELLKILCPKDYGLFSEVNLAVEDPQGYFEEYQVELAERGIDDAARVSPWLAMIDGLISRKCLVEVDWKEAATDLIESIQTLPLCRERAVDLSSFSKRSEQPEQLLPEIAQVLGRYNLTLCSPYIESDSWPLAVVDKSSAEQVQNLASDLGEKVTIFSLQ